LSGNKNFLLVQANPQNSQLYPHKRFNFTAFDTTRGTSIGAHVLKQVQERFFDLLDHEIVHVSGTHSSPVVSKVLERAALAKREEIARGLLAVMA